MIVFVILVLFTMKFIWPPITVALDERARQIAEGLAAADKATAELAPVARPYAEALYKSAHAELTGPSNWLDALAAVASNAQLLSFAGNPKVSAQQVFDVVSDVARVELPKAGQNFLRTIIDNG